MAGVIDVEKFWQDMRACAEHAGEIVASGLPPFTTSELLEPFYDAGAVRIRRPSKVDGTDDIGPPLPLFQLVTDYIAALDAWASSGRGEEEGRLNRAERALRAAVGAPPGAVSAGNCVKL